MNARRRASAAALAARACLRRCSAGCVQMPTQGPVDRGRQASAEADDAPGISFDPRPPQAGRVADRDRRRLPRGDEGHPDQHDRGARSSSPARPPSAWDPEQQIVTYDELGDPAGEHRGRGSR